MNIQGRHGTFGCISSSFEALLLNIVEFEPAAHRSYYEIICCWLSTFKLPQWQYVWLYHIWGQVKAPFLAFVLDNSFLAKNRFVQVIQRMKLLFVVIHSIFYWLHQNNYNEKAGKISLLKLFLPFFFFEGFSNSSKAIVAKDGRKDCRIRFYTFLFISCHIRSYIFT